MSQRDEQGLWFVLEKIQHDINLLDQKWEQYLIESSKIHTAIVTIKDQVDKLTYLVSTGNGSKSLLVQVAETQKDIAELRRSHNSSIEDMALVRRRVGGVTPKEVKLERMKIMGKIAGIIGLALPGILSWLGVGS
jgi:hypothetical protein